MVYKALEAALYLLVEDPDFSGGFVGGEYTTNGISKKYGLNPKFVEFCGLLRSKIHCKPVQMFPFRD